MINYETKKGSGAFEIVAVDYKTGKVVGNIENIIRNENGEKFIEINSVGVQNAYRGQGIAKELFNLTFKEAQKQNIRKAKLIVRKSGSEAAIHLYEKLDFQRQKDWKGYHCYEKEF